jgi:hypothetical protein
MGKLIVILVAIVILTAAFVLLGNADQAQAQANHVWWLPIVHKNYMPERNGCIEPDAATCLHGPPFNVVTVP